MGDVLIRRVPDEVIKKLKTRAARSGRSLQQELLRILSDSAYHSIDAFADEVHERQAQYRLAGRSFPDSTLDLRQDRDQR